MYILMQIDRHSNLKSTCSFYAIFRFLLETTGFSEQVFYDDAIRGKKSPCKA